MIRSFLHAKLHSLTRGRIVSLRRGGGGGLVRLPSTSPGHNIFGRSVAIAHESFARSVKNFILSWACSACQLRKSAMTPIDDSASLLTNMEHVPAAKQLLQHIRAVKASAEGGSAQEPHTQIVMWRRLLQHRIATGGALVQEKPGGLPACLLVCNLSGHHCCYYSENRSLVLTLCAAGEASNVHIAPGLDQVVESAKQRQCCVVAYFYLPFQCGVENAYWEVDTLAKIEGGRIDTCVLRFCRGDKIARHIKKSGYIEQWSKTQLQAAWEKMSSSMPLVDVDVRKCDTNLNMAQMQACIRMLKDDRKKSIAAHDLELELQKKCHSAECVRLEEATRQTEAVHANERVSKVVAASIVVRTTLERGTCELREQADVLRRELATANLAMKRALSEQHACELQRDHEISKCKQREMQEKKDHQERCMKYRVEMQKLKVQLCEVQERSELMRSESEDMRQEMDRLEEAILNKDESLCDLKRRHLTQCDEKNVHVIAENDKLQNELLVLKSELSQYLQSNKSLRATSMLHKQERDVCRGLLQLAKHRFSVLVKDLEEKTREAECMQRRLAAVEEEQGQKTNARCEAPQDTHFPSQQYMYSANVPMPVQSLDGVLASIHQGITILSMAARSHPPCYYNYY